MKNRLPLIILSALAGYMIGTGTTVFAQVSGSSPGFLPTDVWNTLITSSPLAAALGYGYWTANSERKQLQTERADLLERVVVALTQATATATAFIATNEKVLSAISEVTGFMVRERKP